MTYCSICQEQKPDHCVLHAPERLPERGERPVPLHTACVDCITALVAQEMPCPICRTPLAPQVYGNIHSNNRSCGQALKLGSVAERQVIAITATHTARLR